MRQLFRNLKASLPLFLIKGKKIIPNDKSMLNMDYCRASVKLKNTEMAVMPHYKPILKIEL